MVAFAYDPAPGEVEKENLKFMASLSYTDFETSLNYVRLCLKKIKKKKRNKNNQRNYTHLVFQFL